MHSVQRKIQIMEALKREQQPVSASRLAEDLGVSRQVIVGDIALLRASGYDITATARGYTLPQIPRPGRFVGKLACRHSLADTQKELSLIVDLGGEIIDVTVEHYLYGEITGQLNIRTKQDVDAFMEKVDGNRARLLSELTQGVHLHTIACRDKQAFLQIRQTLSQHDLLYVEEHVKLG